MRPITTIFLITCAVFFIGHYVGRTRPIFVKDPKPRNYQIELHNDTIWLYRGDKLVSKYITDYSKGLDSIIYLENN